MSKKNAKYLVAPATTPKTMVAIPGMDTAPLLFTKSVLGLKIENGTPFGFALSSLIYDARNSLVVDAINGRFDRVLWLDTDMLFDADLLVRLNEVMDKENADLVTGIYFSRKPPLDPVIYSKVAMRQDEKGQLIKEVEKYLDYPEDSVFPIAGCGFGGCLMKVDLAIKMLQTYGTCFAPLPGFGEDLSFCLRANDMEAKMVCDSSIKLYHIGYTTFGEEDFKLLKEERKNG